MVKSFGSFTNQVFPPVLFELGSFRNIHFLAPFLAQAPHIVWRETCHLPKGKAMPAYLIAYLPENGRQFASNLAGCRLASINFLTITTSLPQ
ncbi:MAG: hypothetical protein K2X81_16620 [Candidatus Obscuribacterales bacterium]|nr:hypothetical protein [Candidatus Obscuribacterales bacterium]